MIYKKTKCFAWPRVPYAVLGAFALIWIPVLVYKLFGGKDSGFAAFLTVVLTAMGLLLARSLSNFRTKTARGA